MKKNKAERRPDLVRPIASLDSLNIFAPDCLAMHGVVSDYGLQLRCLTPFAFENGFFGFLA